MTTTTVFYQVFAKGDDQWNGISQDINGFNCFELRETQVESLLLYDILYAISRNTSLSNLLNHQYQYYVQYQQQLIHLPSPSSIIPVGPDGIIILKLLPGISPLISKRQLSIFQEASKEKLGVGTRATARASASGGGKSGNRQERPAPYRERNDSYDQFDQGVSSFERNPANAPSNNNSSASYGVTDFQDAAEVAKEAARSLFAFAANMSKSVMDVAQNIATNATTSGAPGGLAPGTTITISRTRVQIIRALSEGGFGMVYIVKNEQGKSLALKQLLCQSKEQVEEAHKEVDALLMCQECPYVVSLIDHSSTIIGHGNSGLRQVLLLFPLYPRGTAWEAMERSGATQDPASVRSIPWPFPEKKAIAIVHCVASALAFLHDKGYAHRDVKPHNVLLTDEDNISAGAPVAVLMDFGSITPAKVQINTRQDALRVEDEAASKTSAAYRSPELTTPPIPPFTIDERVDTWGLGCTMYCLAFGRSPFETPKEGIARLAIMNAKYTVPSDRQNRNCKYSEAYIQLIQRMLHVDLASRPFIPEIISLCENWPVK